MSERYRSGDYARDNPDWHAADAWAKATGLLRVLHDWDLLGRPVVELGCGTGHVLAHLARRQPRVAHTGFDIASEALSRAPTLDNVQWRLGSLLDSEVTAEVGLALDVLEHLDDPVDTLAALAAHAPVWVLRLPLERSLRATVRPGRLQRSRAQLGHLHHWSWEQALEVVKEAGFTVQAVRVDHPRPRGGLPGRLARQARRLLDPVDPRLAPWLVGEDSLWVYTRPRT